MSRSTQTSQVKGFVWLHPGSDKDPFVYRDSYWHQDLTQSCSLHWNDNNAFELIIKHELGHVMGFTHVAGTLMDEKFLEATALNQCQVWPHVERNVRDEPLNLNIDASPVYFQSNRQILMSPSVSGFVSRHLISPFVHQTLVWDNRSIPATLTYTPEGLRITGTASTGPFQVDLEASNRIFGSKTGLFTELDDVFVVCEIGIRFSNESIECTTLKQLAFVRSFQARDESGKHHHFILSYNMES
ncbi:MAG: hypothetical protein NTV34_12280, partial [Proteobacteria bacterium]|nr:hypothetical protein [Pseudomonadota bacterium]